MPWLASISTFTSFTAGIYFDEDWDKNPKEKIEKKIGKYYKVCGKRKLKGNSESEKEKREK